MPPSKPYRISLVNVQTDLSSISTSKTTISTSNYEFSSTIGYQSTFPTQQTMTASNIAESDNITFVCAGNVGNPPTKHVFLKYLDKHKSLVNYTATETSISEISENCSYYLTSNLTYQVTAEDNKAVMRCVVDSPIAELDMYIQTEPIDVYCEYTLFSHFQD